MIITSQLAQCLTPAKNWDLPETWVVLQFQKSNRLIRSTGPSSFYQIRSILLGVSPSAGQACGMISVTITGRGFDVRSATPYTLVLDSRYAGPCTAVNLTTLNCVVLRWQSTLTTLLLVNHNLTSSLISADKLGLGSWIGADPSRSNSSILFQFWPCCERIEVGQAVSLVPTVIPIEGVGMKSLKNASCIFTFGEKIVKVPLKNINDTLSICITPIWTYSGCASNLCNLNSTLSFFVDSTFVCDVHNFSFLSAVSSITPTKGPASGGHNVTIFGGGLNPTTSYTCIFSCGDIKTASNSLAVETDMLVCEVPQSHFVPCDAEIFVYESINNHVTMVFNTSSLRFSYFAEWQSLSDNTAPMIGGSFLSVFGIFDITSTYVCYFTGPSANRNSPASVISPTELSCLIPQWSTGSSLTSSVLTFFSLRLLFAGGSQAVETVPREPDVPCPFYFIQDYVTQITSSSYIGTSPLQFWITETVILTFVGHFTLPTSSYICVIDAGITAGSGSRLRLVGNVTMQSISSPSMTFKLGAWYPFPSSLANVFLVVNGSPELQVPQTGGPSTIIFRPFWTKLFPSSGGFSGHTSVTIIGVGFSAHPEVYTCLFCSSVSHYCLSTPVANQSYSQMSCL